MGGLSNKKLPMIKSMKTRQSKSFKQFMLDLDPSVRTGIFLQIAKQCHVTLACVRMWVRDDSSPQEWRMQVINNIAKKFDCVVEFTPIKRRHYLEGLDNITPTNETEL